jgi:hypothetical protein
MTAPPDECSFRDFRLTLDIARILARASPLPAAPSAKSRKDVPA